MAKNKLSDLNDHLFVALERLNDEDLKPEDIEKESLRTKAIVSISSQVINSAKLTLEAMKAVSSGDYSLGDLPESFGIQNKIESKN